MRGGFLPLLGFIVLITPIGALASQSRPFPLISADQPGPLTLTGAKQVVAQSLLRSGERLLRIGHAEFDGHGNVIVEVQTIQGIPFRHVLVDGQTHEVAATRTRASSANNG